MRRVTATMWLPTEDQVSRWTGFGLLPAAVVLAGVLWVVELCGFL